MTSHPNRSRKAKRAEPALGWTYGQFLPNIPPPLLIKMQQSRTLEAQLRALRREIHQEVSARWSPEEVEQAKKALQDEYERATGRPHRLDQRIC
jgi:hypothetical protein